MQPVHASLHRIIASKRVELRHFAKDFMHLYAFDPYSGIIVQDCLHIKIHESLCGKSRQGLESVVLRVPIHEHSAYLHYIRSYFQIQKL